MSGDPGVFASLGFSANEFMQGVCEWSKVGMTEEDIHAWVSQSIERPGRYSAEESEEEVLSRVKEFALQTQAHSNQSPQQEEIDRPSRYGGDTCMKAIADACTPEELRGFIKMTIFRYLWREQHKGGDRDLQKAQWYLNWYLQHIGEKSKND